MDKKVFSDEAKQKQIGRKSKLFSNYLTKAQFSFSLAKSPQCTMTGADHLSQEGGDHSARPGKYTLKNWL